MSVRTDAGKRTVTIVTKGTRAPTLAQKSLALRYQPTDPSALVGNHDQQCMLASWVRERAHNRPNAMPAAIIMGPTGSGKSTAARVMLASGGFGIMELGPGSLTPSMTLTDHIERIVSTRAVLDRTRTAVIVDDFDGICAMEQSAAESAERDSQKAQSDYDPFADDDDYGRGRGHVRGSRGGRSASGTDSLCADLVELGRERRHRSVRRGRLGDLAALLSRALPHWAPIIICSNDAGLRDVLLVRDLCLQVWFHGVQARDLMHVALRVALREGRTLTEPDALQLASNAAGDVRALLNALEMHLRVAAHASTTPATSERGQTAVSPAGGPNLIVTASNNPFLSNFAAAEALLAGHAPNDPAPLGAPDAHNIFLIDQPLMRAMVYHNYIPFVQQHQQQQQQQQQNAHCRAGTDTAWMARRCVHIRKQCLALFAQPTKGPHRLEESLPIAGATHATKPETRQRDQRAPPSPALAQHIKELDVLDQLMLISDCFSLADACDYGTRETGTSLEYADTYDDDGCYDGGGVAGQANDPTGNRESIKTATTAGQATVPAYKAHAMFSGQRNGGKSTVQYATGANPAASLLWAWSVTAVTETFALNRCVEGDGDQTRDDIRSSSGGKRRSPQQQSSRSRPRVQFAEPTLGERNRTRIRQKRACVVPAMMHTAWFSDCSSNMLEYNLVRLTFARLALGKVYDARPTNERLCIVDRLRWCGITPLLLRKLLDTSQDRLPTIVTDQRDAAVHIAAATTEAASQAALGGEMLGPSGTDPLTRDRQLMPAPPPRAPRTTASASAITTMPMSNGIVYPLARPERCLLMADLANPSKLRTDSSRLLQGQHHRPSVCVIVTDDTYTGAKDGVKDKWLGKRKYDAGSWALPDDTVTLALLSQSEAHASPRRAHLDCAVSEATAPVDAEKERPVRKQRRDALAHLSNARKRSSAGGTGARRSTWTRPRPYNSGSSSSSSSSSNNNNSGKTFARQGGSSRPQLPRN